MTPRGTASTGSTEGPNTPATSRHSSNAPSRSAGTESPAGPPIGAPKGKLVVKIVEARGLVPSKCPYVVCTFESNEFISQGPKKADSSGGEHDDSRAKGEAVDSSGPVSALGKSMAIPMKSRQSSSTSLSEIQGTMGTKGGATGITDPKWEHEAVL